jgi:hypothetical protein
MSATACKGADAGKAKYATKGTIGEGRQSESMNLQRGREKSKIGRF